MKKVKIESTLNMYRLVNPGSVVLISVGNGTRDNLFAVTWNMPVRKDPGMVAILSGKRHFSYPLMMETREFGVNIPDISLVDAVYGCGTVSGFNEPDKFSRFGLTRREPEQIKAPLVEEAVAHLECRIFQVVDLAASSLIIADILTAEVAPKHFKDGHWNYANGLQLIHHLGTNRFGVSEREVVAKKL